MNLLFLNVFIVQAIRRIARPRNLFLLFFPHSPVLAKSENHAIFIAEKQL
jgi:hypothetical protein